jgi:hypothetical protein
VGGEGDALQAAVGDEAGVGGGGDEDDDAGLEGVEGLEGVSGEGFGGLGLRPARFGAQEQPLAGGGGGGLADGPGVEAGRAAAGLQAQRAAAEREAGGEGAQEEAADPELAVVLDEDGAGEGGALGGGEVGEGERVDEVAVADPRAGDQAGDGADVRQEGGAAAGAEVEAQALAGDELLDEVELGLPGLSCRWRGGCSRRASCACPGGPGGHARGPHDEGRGRGRRGRSR